MEYLQSYISAGIFVAVGVGFGLFAYFLSYILRPKRIDSENAKTAYECGIQPEKDAKVKFNIRYLIYLLIFVAFDVEAIFLYPWAVKTSTLGWYAFIEVTIFVSIILIGWIYAWGRGLLKWD